jgi:hypothetical protein
VSIDENAPLLCVEIDAETSGVTLRGLEVSGGFYAVYLGSQWDYDDTPLDNLAAHSVVIEDCVLHDAGRDVVKIPAGCDDVTIRRCEIYNSGTGYPDGTPQEEKNAEGIDAVNADDMHVSDTYIHDTATTCLYVKGGSIGTVIERTRVERCGDLGIVLGFDTSPEFFDLTANPGYYESIGGVVRNCVIADTGLAGLGLYATRDAHLLHNTVMRAGRQRAGGDLPRGRDAGLRARGGASGERAADDRRQHRRPVGDGGAGVFWDPALGRGRTRRAVGARRGGDDPR